ncbi:MAG: ATP-binding protein [Planctomycetota bacterium]|nr:ATP-binding protein [Planctomycetota bacterium]
MKLEPEDLRSVIAKGEGRQVEFKRGLPRDHKTARTLVAFANTRGGLLLIGVGDKSELLGAPKPRVTLERLREIAEHSVEPPVAVELALVELDGKKLVACWVPLSAQRPHSVRRPDGELETVVRAGSSNRGASGPTLKAIGATSHAPPDELERRVLNWVGLVSRGGAAANSPATIDGFCKAQNIGRQRARRAFIELERSGRLVGHGLGARRTFSVA